MAFAHRQVALAARRIAHEFYSVGANENGFYKRYPKENAFVENFFHHFIPAARRALTDRAEHPDTPIAVKLEIGKILALEETMPKGNGGAAPPAPFDDRDWSERA
jgi:hypothetical protein